VVFLLPIHFVFYSTGEIKVILFNHGENNFTIKTGDRIAQLIFERIFTNELQEVEELVKTERGAGGFGSTGL
jgi:dUTP pyrophosphatase